MAKKKEPVKVVREKKPVKVEKNYDQDFEYICLEIERGKSVRKACPAFMSLEKFYKLLNESEVKAKRYAHACEARADAIFDDLLDIADDSTNDTYDDDNGVERTNTEVIQRSKLRVDTRKWMLAKLSPKKYGDKIEVESNSKIEVTEKPDFTTLSKEELRAMIDLQRKLKPKSKQ